MRPSSTFSKFIFLGILTGLLSSCGGDTRDTYPQTQVVSAPAPQQAEIVIDGFRSDFVVKRSAQGIVLSEKNTSIEKTYSGFPIFRFKDSIVDTAMVTKLQGLTDKDVNALLELYVAFFNRVPDSQGLSYWASKLKQGVTIDQIAASFYEAAVLYPELTGYTTGMSNTAFIQIIYRNVLGRQTVDQAGLDYWNAELSSGRSSRARLVWTILNAAHTFKNDATYGAVADLLDRKIEVARYVAIDEGVSYTSDAENIRKGMEIAKAVTPTDSSTAKLAVGFSDVGVQAKLLGLSVDTSNQFLTVAGEQGKLGYLYHGNYYLNGATYTLYTKNFGKNALYEYEVATAGWNKAEALKNLNAFGARGFYFYGTYLFGDGTKSLFIHNKSDPRVFKYRLEDVYSTSKETLTKLESLGKDGYQFTGSFIFSDGTVGMYVDENGDGATYQYKLLPGSGSADSEVSRLNELGAQGFRFAGSIAQSDGIFTIYQKRSTDTQAYRYAALGNAGDYSGWLSQLNSQGNHGYRFLMSSAFGVGSTYSTANIYVQGDYIRHSPFGF